MMKQFTGTYMHPLTLADHPILLTATTRFKEYHSGICVISHNIHITLEPSNKQCSIEVMRSATRCFLCSRRGRFLKAITPYVQNSWLPPAGCKGCWRVRWQRDYLDTYILIWFVLSHNHYDKFSCNDPSWIWVWAPYKTISKQNKQSMKTSSNGNFFHVTGPLWGESTGHRWFPPTKGQ